MQHTHLVLGTPAGEACRTQASGRGRPGLLLLRLTQESTGESQKAPSLFMTGDWYQLEQLKKYKAGIRGGNPKNSYGLVMRGFAMGFADEQAMKDVVAYIQSLATTGGQE